MDKLLRKFCSHEIRIMLTKMEEDYGVFTEYNNPWMRLAEITRHMTKVEKYCVKRVKNRMSDNYERQQYLAKILRHQLAPMTMHEFQDDVVPSAEKLRALVAAKQAHSAQYAVLNQQNTAQNMFASAAAYQNTYISNGGTGTNR